MRPEGEGAISLQAAGMRSPKEERTEQNEAEKKKSDRFMDRMRKVTVYGTLGPSCQDRAVLQRMFEEGMDGIRLNLSHSSLEAAKKMIDAFQSAAERSGVKPELLIDMQGPEIRIGDLDEPLLLKEGALVRTEEIPFSAPVIRELEKSPGGQEILLDDGKILLRTEGEGRLLVVRGGLLQSRKSAALPGKTIPTPAMTPADLENISRAKEFGVTALMQPFVRSREDLEEVRAALAEAGCETVRLFAKIENLEGIARLNELIPACDEIVIARGDLGNAMPLWELPAAQKRIAASCRAAGRDFMVVTQMLDSMMSRPVPTRAEVSDIFNAVLDGAASVMVTGESAGGAYPVQAIRYLRQTAEAALRYAGEVQKE